MQTLSYSMPVVLSFRSDHAPLLRARYPGPVALLLPVRLPNASHRGRSLGHAFRKARACTYTPQFRSSNAEIMSRFVVPVITEHCVGCSIDYRAGATTVSRSPHSNAMRLESGCVLSRAVHA